VVLMVGTTPCSHRSTNSEKFISSSQAKVCPLETCVARVFRKLPPGSAIPPKSQVGHSSGGERFPLRACVHPLATSRTTLSVSFLFCTRNRVVGESLAPFRQGKPLPSGGVGLSSVRFGPQLRCTIVRHRAEVKSLTTVARQATAAFPWSDIRTSSQTRDATDP
jgi:hypothetical protein